MQGNNRYERKVNGAVAQLGERLNGIQEVRGSIPLGSIKGDWGITRSPFLMEKRRLEDVRFA